jgi:S-methylmethionine-dependent homocysteine/selenocysteine methylase
MGGKRTFWSSVLPTDNRAEEVNLMPLAKLPQLESAFLTDAGLETDIMFNRGIELPHFASITLLRPSDGARSLEDYFRGFLELAARVRSGLILESATWRASPDWAQPLGLSQEELDALTVRRSTCSCDYEMTIA